MCSYKEIIEFYYYVVELIDVNYMATTLVPLKVNLREHVLTELQGDSWYLKVTSKLQRGR
jgi:hypothetical protein